MVKHKQCVKMRKIWDACVDAHGPKEGGPIFMVPGREAAGRKRELLEIFNRAIRKRDEGLRESIKSLKIRLDKSYKKDRPDSPLPF